MLNTWMVLSQHSSKNELQSCKNEHSWYYFYSYVILVSMNLWTQNLTFYFSPYFLQYAIYTTLGVEKVLYNKCNTFFQYHWKLHMIDWQQNYHMGHISYCMVCIDGGQCFMFYGSTQSNKSLKFWHCLLVASMEPSGTILWWNGEFLIFSC